ncbi:hypothetical protein HD806DRAFT_524488 [Xylariaceae sp. AK1471]|nr:hypothetical protein HD806DRAFT_524488 [Xylariaceae sp. AK1471]
MSGTQQDEKPAEQLEEDKRQRRHNELSRPTVPTAEDFPDVVEHNSPEAESSIDLIQFLKKTPPPPTNYMSIPEDFSSSKDDKCEKLKVKVFHFRHQRRGRKSHPPLIKLPDSAVAATTIDGHRYIAISIPIEYSHLAPLPSSQYPVHDSIEAAFQREIDYRFGAWRNMPTNRLVTVLNPVAEDHESLSPSSLPPRSQPDETAVVSTPSRRAQPYSASLLPNHEQRTSMPGTTEMSAPGPSDPDEHTRIIQTAETSSNQSSRNCTRSTQREAAATASQDIPVQALSKRDVVTSNTGHVPGKPVVILTVPSRTSSKREKQIAPTPPEKIENVVGSQSPSASTNGASSGNGGSGHSNGYHRPRGSFADSIVTTNSSPQLLKAQTAMAFHSVPIVVRSSGGSAGTDVGSPPLDLNLSETGSKIEKVDHSIQTSSESSAVRESSEMGSLSCSTPTSREWMRRRKKRGKEKEPELQSYSFMPGMPPPLPKTQPSAILGHHQRKDTSSPTPSTSSSPFTPTSAKSSESAPSESPSHQRQTKRGEREERKARYIAKTLAEEKETLESLSREELIQRYEALREYHIYEREKRLRKFERNRDTWVRAVPVLLENLNRLLQEQHRLLKGANTGGLAPSKSHLALAVVSMRSGFDGLGASTVAANSTQLITTSQLKHSLLQAGLEKGLGTLDGWDVTKDENEV